MRLCFANARLQATIIKMLLIVSLCAITHRPVAISYLAQARSDWQLHTHLSAAACHPRIDI